MNKVMEGFPPISRFGGLILITALLFLASCGNANLENALAPDLDMPIVAEAEQPADVAVDFAQPEPAAEVVAAEAVEEAVVEAPVPAVETPAEVVEAPAAEEEAVVEAAPEPVVEQAIEVIEVEGMAVNPDSITPNGKAVGYYKSFDGGRDMTLALRPNGNFELRIDMHNGQEPLIYIGTWVTGADTFTIRIAGVEHGGESLSDSFVFSRAGDFIYSGQFMGSDVSFYNFKALAAGIIMPEYDQATATTRFADKSYVGTYKVMMVAFDAPGRDATIVLNEDGSMEWTTFALNRDEPTIETGTWMADESGLLSLMVTERDGRQQSPARAFNFTLQDGVMHSDKFHASLFALPDLFVGGGAIQTGNN